MKRSSLKERIIAKYRSNFGIIIIGLVLFFLGCVSPFTPDYQGVSDLLTVDASLIKGIETQVVSISRASSISDTRYYPVENCQVKIMDETGNEFAFTEESKGKYTAHINDALLSYDKRYKLVFNTPSGDTYESGYQQLLKTAPIDSVYSVKETRCLPNTDEYVKGLQFYVDLDAPDDASRYYRWVIQETWELHAGHMITGIYNGQVIKFDIDTPADSLYYCWDTKLASGLYTYSTGNLSHNILKEIPLHFKQYDSKDLTIKYCATVRQFALNEDAYDYWHQKEIELNESGQIYTTQPSQINSNIYNIDDPGEKVLGFFWASSVTEKHLFIVDPFSNPFAIGPESCISFGACGEFVDEKLMNSLYYIAGHTKNFPAPPVYMYFTTNLISGIICVYFSKDECVDCRLIAGTNKKPDFWK